jgi:hypothetical protein
MMALFDSPVAQLAPEGLTLEDVVESVLGHSRVELQAALQHLSNIGYLHTTIDEEH